MINQFVRFELNFVYKKRKKWDGGLRVTIPDSQW